MVLVAVSVGTTRTPFYSLADPSIRECRVSEGISDTQLNLAHPPPCTIFTLSFGFDSCGIVGTAGGFDLVLFLATVVLLGTGRG